MWLDMLGDCCGSTPVQLVNDGDLLLLIDGMVMLMKVWFLMVGVGSKTEWGTMLQMRLRTVLLLLGATCLGCVVGGILLF